MTEIVISECYGGFGFSKAAWDRLRELGIDVEYDHQLDDVAKRDDPRLIQVVRELGKEASGTFADLAIVTVPDDVDWYIEEYDGFEHVAEGRRWSSSGEM